jgi:SNF2 family DNA or RNA helicase
MTLAPLMKHQSEGVDLLVKGHAFLAFEPGLGKTRTTIAALDKLRVKSRVLVICPAIARVNWQREFEKWQEVQRTVHVCKPGDTTPADVYVMSYDSISIMTTSERNFMLSRPWNTIILDEAHRLKNPDAKRTKMIYGHRATMKKSLAANAKRVWLLSGTPAPNDASEMWTHLAALHPEAITGMFGEPMNFTAFQDAFCTVRTTVYGRQVTGSRNIPELRRRMGGFFLPKREKDCLDLPALIWDTHELPVDDLKEKTVLARLDEILKPYAEAPDPVKALQGAGTHIAEERRLLGTLKAPLVAEYVQNELKNAPKDFKVIVFFWHKDVGRILYEMLVDYRPVLIHGGTVHQARQSMLDQFQNDPKCRVFIGQMQATGEAINLVNARRVIFAEASWTPKDNYQAAKRAHRIGQNASVHASFAALAGSMDARILRTIEKKSRDLEKIMQ